MTHTQNLIHQCNDALSRSCSNTRLVVALGDDRNAVIRAVNLDDSFYTAHWLCPEDRKLEVKDGHDNN